ncbi:MAG: hypothetical protein ABSE89_08305 [Sedimentisphaerales bacterium]
MKQKKQKNAQVIAQILPQDDKKQKQTEIFLFFLLLAFGVYQAVIYWGHKVVPHPDFTGFTAIGRQILSFQMPADFKRVPLLGILQISLGKITGGPNPDFTGAWLLNSIAHSLTAVLLWLVGRKIIGRAAIWFAIIAIINPWGLQLLTEAIAETTLLFFIWATLYLIFIRSKWAYLLAALTSMVRYEGAALILCAFVLDMIEAKDKKERIQSFIFAAVASAPLLLWLAGTVFLEKGMGTTHYFKFFTKEYKQQFVGDVAAKTGFIKNADLLWQVGFYQLFLPSPGTGQDTAQSLMNLSKFFVLVSFLFGSVYGLLKRQWKILVLLLFIVPYFWLHAKYPFLVPRYYATIFGIVLLICIYGLQSFWNLINENLKIPQGIIILLQSVLLMIAFIWAFALSGYLSRLAPMSKASTSLPYVSILVVLAVLTACFLAHKNNVLKKVTVLMLMILIIVSNQFVVAPLLGNGQGDIEFKFLADWYIQNAKSGEKLVCTMANLLESMAPQYTDYFIPIDRFRDVNSPAEFVQECYRKNITYVAWDSRIGLVPQDDYYKIWKMQNLAPLAAGRDVGPYQFITQLKANERRYIYVYRLLYEKK